MDRHQFIQKAESFIQWLDRQIDGIEMRSDLRNRLAAGCLEMTLEHQRGIVLLIAKNIHGSAFALIRPLFESYVRGIWLHKCASESNLDRFIKGKDLGKFADLCAAVEKLEAFQEGLLSQIKMSSWKAMNGFTHTGIHQVARRHTEETIEANYDEVEILEAMKFACGIGWLAAIAICDLADNAELANAILQKVKDLFPSEELVTNA